MEEQLVSFETAKLAREKGFNVECRYGYTRLKELMTIDRSQESFFEGASRNYRNSELESYNKSYLECNDDEYVCIYTALAQSLLQKFIRETRGVHIEIHRNASGYYWSMCKADGGTDLGWSDISGPNDGGVWDSFEDALENALQVQLSYDLPNDMTIIKHWGNYVEFALKSK